MSSNGEANSESEERTLRTSQRGEAIRRRWERLPIAVPIFVRGLDENGKNFVEFSAATNLNAGGMLLVCRRKFTPGQEVHLEIPSPAPHMNPRGQDSRNTFSATVLYSEYSEGFHLCGVQFYESILPDPGETE